MKAPLLRQNKGRNIPAWACPGKPFAGKVPGYDHLEPEKLSGSIDLEMIVRTPLVFGKQTIDTKGPKDRHFIDVGDEPHECA